MLVRNMTVEDISAVVKIEKECFSLPWSEKSFEESIPREDTIFLVCEEDESIMGYIGMYLSFDEASITNVAVASQFRKRGCAKQLVIAAKKAAKEAGAASIFLEVRFSNEPALSLYKKEGFENIGIRKNFYQHPVEDAIIMKVGI
jgi:ribosomal-protein-alanine N-acetyltransferase